MSHMTHVLKRWAIGGGGRPQISASRGAEERSRHQENLLDMSENGTGIDGLVSSAFSGLHCAA